MGECARGQRKPERTLVAAGKHVEFWRANGWEYVHRSDAKQGVTIVAVTDENGILLVEQYRAPLGRNAIELPAGLVGEAGANETEAVAAAVKRELQEETGYTCKHVAVVVTGSSSPGITDELNALCLAQGVTKADETVEWVKYGDGVRKQALPRGLREEGERITVYEVAVEGARAWLARRNNEGLVVDLKVFAGLYFATSPDGIR